MDPRRAIQQQLTNMSLRDSILRGASGTPIEAGGRSPPRGAPGLPGASPQDPRQTGLRTSDGRAVANVEGENQQTPDVPPLIDGMPPVIARLAAAAAYEGVQQETENRAHVYEAKELYERARPWGDATPDKEASWRRHGKAFMEMLDQHPGLERRFAISPDFVRFVQTELGFQTQRSRASYRPAVQQAGLGLLMGSLEPPADAVTGTPMARKA